MAALGLRPKRGALAALALALSVATAGAVQAEPAAGNRLAGSNDPYLLQHARNPVDWYPWGPEAVARARRENKPIFVSIGYSTCFWCHVAEETIYSKPAFAALMNQWFVNVKVDREQRPDVDRIYQLATELMTGHGGWPNNLFLTPELKPFFAGSYFPPEDDERGRPGFATVLEAVHTLWEDDPSRARATAERAFAALQRYQSQATATGATAVEPAAWRERAVRRLEESFDPENGGFGKTLKFPRAPALALLLRAHREGDRHSLEMATATLDAMTAGGIHDHLAGGFHRYAVEATWGVPHFEKMLYDNAQLLGVFVTAWKITGQARYREQALELGGWMLREMQAPDGGFYTALDAAVDGREGTTYLWTHAEIREVLGADDAEHFLRTYTLTPLPPEKIRPDSPEAVEDPPGVLRLRRDAAAEPPPAQWRQRLLQARSARVQPARDNKLLLGLNGLAIESLAMAAKAFGRKDFEDAARRAAQRLWHVGYDPRRHTLSREIFGGRAHTEGFLEDYALLGRGFLALAENTGDKRWHRHARELGAALARQFLRPDGSLTPAITQDLLPMLLPDDGDDALPCGTSAAIDLLGRVDHGPRAREAQRILTRVSGQVAQNPVQWPALLAWLPESQAAHAGSRQATLATPVATAGVVTGHIELDLGTTPPRVIATIEIAPGYHVNANPASLDYLVPTRLNLEGAGAPLYPEATLFRPSFAKDGLRVYEGRISLSAPLATPVKDLASLRATLTVQACNAASCLPPATITLPPAQRAP